MYTHHVFIRAIYKVHYVLFRRKYHYWLIAFVTPTGGIRHVITVYRNKRLTLARILQAAIGEGLDTNCVVLPPSYLGKMTEAQANTEL